MKTTPDDERGNEMKALARTIFLHALGESGVRSAFERSISTEGGVLRVCEDLYDLRSYDQVFVVSVGKAGRAMAAALTDIAGAFSGIIADPSPAEHMVPGFEFFQGGHPTPNGESARAANTILRTLARATEYSFVIFLISGGASAVVEAPLYESVTLDDLAATHRALVHSGAPITEINTIRKHLSAVKGGRMAVAAGAAQQVSILISDVPEASLDALASGPTVPDSTTVADCYSVVKRYSLLPQLPHSIRDLFHHNAIEETPKADDPAFARARWWTVLSNATAQRAAVEKARAAGLRVVIDNSCDDQDYRVAADHLLAKIRELRDSSTPVCLISGGEVTVEVTRPGVGGRNQQFALYCAEKIAGEKIAVLSAGTDGIDGNSPAAGAVVHGKTWQRATENGLAPEVALRDFNAFPLFETLADVIVTGPTGTNVRDLRIAIAW